MKRMHIACCLVVGLFMVGACDKDAQNEETPDPNKGTPTQSTPDTSVAGSSMDAHVPADTESRCFNKFSSEYTPCCDPANSQNGLSCDAATWVECTPEANAYCLCKCDSDGKVVCAC